MTPEERRIYTPYEKPHCQDSKKALAMLMTLEYLFGKLNEQTHVHKH